MVISSGELERIEDELAHERIIRTSVYCGRCGYNLRTLPHVYTCPECGNPYNARPLKMEGIFLPHTTHVPVGDIIAFLFCAAVAAALVVAGVANRDVARALIGVFFAVLGMFLAVQAYRRLMRYVQFRAIYKRIIRGEHDQD